MTRVAIVQSNYIPWKGYFDLIGSVDKFLLYDDVQFTKNDWRNRNKIKTPAGIQWLTIPVSQGIDQRICDVRIADRRWRAKHWKTIQASYARAPYFKTHQLELAEIYDLATYDRLSEVNHHCLQSLCKLLGIATNISSVLDLKATGGRNERLVEICKELGGTVYVSGPAARSYLDTVAFEKAGIAVEWFDYSGYPSYTQMWGPFEHSVSIIDTIFNCGTRETSEMLRRRRTSQQA